MRLLEIFTKPPHFVYIIRCSWDGAVGSGHTRSSFMQFNGH